MLLNTQKLVNLSHSKEHANEFLFTRIHCLVAMVKTCYTDLFGWKKKCRWMTSGMWCIKRCAWRTCAIGRRGKASRVAHGILKNWKSCRRVGPGCTPRQHREGPAGESAVGRCPRAAKARGFSLETYSDEKNYYLWRKVPEGNKAGGRKLRR